MDAGSRFDFQRLAPVSDRYATMPIADAFTWDACLPEVDPAEWYMVAFRSVRRADADETRLTAYDDWAHTEAMEAPGFVHYFKGPANERGECLSFCLWNSRVEARAAAGRPAHIAAAALTFESYAQYRLEFHRVRRVAGVGFTFEPYDQEAARPRTEQPRAASGLRVQPAPG
jgi:hypothetical protein